MARNRSRRKRVEELRAKVRRRRLALALVAAMAMPVQALAQNLPTAGEVTSGNATIGTSGNTMTINQSTQGAIIDWGTFNIASGNTVNYVQPTNGVTLNRVIGWSFGNSMIDGTLSANGSVFLVNPAGIAFGSGAQVNVGSLIASTMDISNANFLAGLSTGHYVFDGESYYGEIHNNGQIVAANGGTVGLFAPYIYNNGTIIANYGSIVLGAAETVTVDFFGDGLTQIAISGGGSGITSHGNLLAEGGHIELRTNTVDGLPAGTDLFVDPSNGGRIWIGGNVATRTGGDRRGSILIDAGMGNIDLGGVDGRTGNVSANADDAGETAGTIELRGNQLFTHLCYGTGPSDLCVNNNRLGLVNASAVVGASAGEILIDVGHLYHGGVIQTSTYGGGAGRIDIHADYAEIYNYIFAYNNDGPGGTINIDADSLLLFRGQQPWLGGPGTAYWSASLLAYGTTTGGTVNIDAGSLQVTNLGNVTPQFPDLEAMINVTDQLGGDGGAINITADHFNLPSNVFFNASGEGQNGTFTLHAPSVTIESEDALYSYSGAVLNDTALGATLSTGTNVTFLADAALGSGSGSGEIYIDGGVSVLHSGADDVSLDFSATGGISGQGFDIESTGGALDLSFTANVNGDNPNYGYVSFYEFGLVTSGGDIHMDADGRGLYLHAMQMDSGGGDIGLFGRGIENGVTVGFADISSGGGAISVVGESIYGSGVRLEGVDFSSSGGDIDLDGVGDAGVWMHYGSLASGGGNISILGDGVFQGVYLGIVDALSEGGDIAIDGTASLVEDGQYPFGVQLAGATIASESGGIHIAGTAAGGSGISMWVPSGSSNSITATTGAISLSSTGLTGLMLDDIDFSTESGDITLYGSALDPDVTAGVAIGSGGIHSNGGDISITGVSAGGTGVWVYGGDLISDGGDISITGTGGTYGVQLWGGTLSSGDGSIDIDGTVTGSASYSTGVLLRDEALVSTTGDISVAGDAAHGTGIFFGSTGVGSSISSGSGDISIISTGVHGLYVSDVPFSTESGDIHLEGHAQIGDGLVVSSGGLSTNGSDITLTGTSEDGLGVWLEGGDITSNGGDIIITGIGLGTGGGGVFAEGVHIDSGAGNVTVDGSAPDGTGISFLAGSSVTTTSGDISIISTGMYGLNVADLPFSTDTGGIHLEGHAQSGFGVFVGSGGLTTNGGDITLIGTTGSTSVVSYGVLVDGGELISHGGDIAITGSSVGGSGVWVQDAELLSGGGDIDLEGHGHGLGGVDVVYSTMDSAGGDIDILGTVTGTATAFATGGSTFSSGTGDITITGIKSGGGAESVGLRNGSVVATTSGDITLAGVGGGNVALGISADSSVESEDGLVVLRASNTGTTDAIALQGSVSSGKAVVLTPYDVDDAILLGAGNGFSLTGAELATIDSPLLVIGSEHHAGVIRVAEAVDWDGDLTLQNQSGSGGIALEAAVDVGEHTLALASGGDITQTSAGAITAHSLLAHASGDVLLAAAQNNVGAGALGGFAGGDFLFQDVDALTIGAVSAHGYSQGSSGGPTGPGAPAGLTTLSDEGIYADGAVRVQTLSDDLILNADVHGNTIDLIAADTFQNTGNASLTAANGWRVWAYTWEGEERGALVGSGPFDVFGCSFGQDCSGLGQGNQFIYATGRSQVAVVSTPVVEVLDELEEETGTPDDKAAAARVCPVGASAGDPTAQGAVGDELGRDWAKIRHRLQLTSCIDSKDQGGCRF